MRFNRSKPALGVVLAFAAIALFFMLTEHRAHTFGALPYVLLALCPLLLYLVAWSHETKGNDGAPPTRADTRTDIDPEAVDRDGLHRDSSSGVN